MVMREGNPVAWFFRYIRYLQGEGEELIVRQVMLLIGCILRKSVEINIIIIIILKQSVKLKSWHFLCILKQQTYLSVPKEALISSNRSKKRF